MEMEWRKRGTERRDDPPSPEAPAEPSPLTAFIYFMCLDNIAFLTRSPLNPLTFFIMLLLQFFFLRFIIFLPPFYLSIWDPLLSLL